MISIKVKSIILLLATLTFSAAHATIYDVLGGTFSHPAIYPGTFTLTSTSGQIFINEGTTAYQAFDSIVDPFIFLGQPYRIGTASSYPGVIGGGYAPSGTVIDGGSVDMSSIFGSWNANPPFNQGGLASVSAIPGGFRLAWESDYLDGPFIGTGPTFWTLDIAAVPVPAAVWLFGSGLVGLVSIARRKHH